MSEQCPFDSVSFIYMLPLITAVLQSNGIGRTNHDEVDEQVTLALEILSYHTHTCKSHSYMATLESNRSSFR